MVQHCSNCQTDKESNEVSSRTLNVPVNRASNFLEVESLKKIIDDLCADNQILHEDFTLCMKTIKKVMDANKELKRQIELERESNVKLPTLKQKLKEQIVSF